MWHSNLLSRHWDQPQHSPGPEIQYILLKGCKTFSTCYEEVCQSGRHKLVIHLIYLHASESLLDLLQNVESVLLFLRYKKEQERSTEMFAHIFHIMVIWDSWMSNFLSFSLLCVAFKIFFFSVRGRNINKQTTKLWHKSEGKNRNNLHFF